MIEPGNISIFRGLGSYKKKKKHEKEAWKLMASKVEKTEVGP